MTTTSSSQRSTGGSVLWWPPEGAGDFADVAWVVAEALGNAAGVRGVDVRRYASRVSVHVTTTSSDLVRTVADGFGWHLHEPDATYATTYGRIGEVRVNVTWIAAGPDDPESTTSGCG